MQNKISAHLKNGSTVALSGSDDETRHSIAREYRLAAF